MEMARSSVLVLRLETFEKRIQLAIDLSFSWSVTGVISPFHSLARSGVTMSASVDRAST
jgi:hypothetical protein